MKFVEDFVSYAQEFTGCPKPFLEWSAILCLSVVAGRRHVMRRGDWDVRPNLWVMLLGNSSSYKSTGLAIARRLLREVIPDALLGQEFSTEKLLDDLAANSHRLFTYDEAETFFKVISLKYNPTLKSAIMTLWRDDWYVRKTKAAEIVIRDAYLCWGGASTSVQIANQINGNDSDLLSGMLPRFCLVPYFGEESSIANPPPSNKEKKSRLVSQLAAYAVCGEREYTYSPEALSIIEKWQTRLTRRISESDPLLGSFYRKMRDEHFHKLAMLFAFSRGVTMIEPADLAHVVERLWQIEQAWPMLMSRLLQTRVGRDREMLLDYLKAQGTVVRGDLLKRFPRINGLELSRMLQSMIEDNLIKTSVDSTRTKPRQVIEYLFPEK